MHDLSNTELLAQRNMWFPKFCLDKEIWGQPRATSFSPPNNWITLKFDMTNYSYFSNNGLEDCEGIYMFVLEKEIMQMAKQEFILYVGETDKLGQRFRQYFGYKNSKHPSDQKKRRMVLFWEDMLYFKFIPTTFGTKRDRESAEYDLIDHLMPPINDKYRSSVSKARTKLIAL